MSAAAAIFPATLEFMGSFMRLSFITPLKIEFLLLFTGCRKVLGKMPDFLILKGLLVILIDCMVFLSPFLDVTKMSMSIVSFLAKLDSGILCL